MNAMGPIRVTVGISHGSPSRLSIHPTTGRADYFGSVVNLSARLASAAHGGQILLEGSPSIDFVENDLAREVDFTLLGSYKFKGIIAPRGTPVLQVTPHQLYGIPRCFPEITNNCVRHNPGSTLGTSDLAEMHDEERTSARGMPREWASPAGRSLSSQGGASFRSTISITSPVMAPRAGSGRADDSPEPYEWE